MSPCLPDSFLYVKQVIHENSHDKEEDMQFKT